MTMNRRKFIKRTSTLLMTTAACALAPPLLAIPIKTSTQQKLQSPIGCGSMGNVDLSTFYHR